MQIIFDLYIKKYIREIILDLKIAYLGLTLELKVLSRHLGSVCVDLKAFSKSKQKGGFLIFKFLIWSTFKTQNNPPLLGPK